MAVFNRKWHSQNVYLSMYAQKELHATAIQMFLRLVNTTGQVRRLPDVWTKSTHRAVSAVV